MAQIAPLAQQAAVTISVEYGGESTVMIDAERTQVAVIHLLEYALRRSPPYSTVQVRTEQQMRMAVVRISDQSPTLAASEREALFDARSISGERGASALGLAFSKLVIELHGGRLWSEGSGSQGNTYAFSLPIDGQ
jgi:signal transduction histidine kinase